ncbi:hypothetical protein [Bartonella sp. AP88XZML]|uniref:hypothetical protein n=1 Tax=Bartonella sp. AP88XZML TaxID=3243506 RepID=UPI0035CF1EEB
MKFFEAALLMSVCQEHGKWRLGKRRKVERRKGVQEGWGGYACEGVVHAGVSCWGGMLGHVLGCLCGRGPKSLLFIEVFLKLLC